MYNSRMRKLGTPEGESPLLGVRVTPEAKRRLERTAKREKVTVSEIIRRAIDAYLRKGGM